MLVMKILNTSGGFKVKNKVWVFDLSLIVVVAIAVLILFNRNEIIKLKDIFVDDVDVSNVSRINIIRSSDNKEIILKGKQAEEFLDTLLNTELKQTKVSDKTIKESFWITTFRENNVAALGVRMDKNLLVDAYSYKGSKNNSKYFKAENGSVFDKTEKLFE
ncbi:hypothetical protein MHB44_20535 [Lysinibacillus sp. FSL H8-0500]|uniref:hypothetical protein n=1 Tax=Lysinibacillus sp. FSL H8-0500 TaxID=2921393 RepID=UPI003101AC0E